jgi:hypothetical protein
MSLHPMAKWVVLQKIKFKTKILLSAMKGGGSTNMFYRDMGAPKQISLRALKWLEPVLYLHDSLFVCFSYIWSHSNKRLVFKLKGVYPG